MNFGGELGGLAFEGRLSGWVDLVLLWWLILYWLGLQVAILLW